MVGVLITRPIEDAEDTAQRIKALDPRYKVYHTPLLQTKPQKSLDVLPQCDGYIFTSSRGVQYSIQYEDAIDKALPAFCVGRTTSDAAQRAGFKTRHIGQGGSMGLIPVILENMTKGQILSHIAGHDVCDGFYQDLIKAGLHIDHIPVYKMEPVTSVSSDIYDALQHDIQVVVFFSSRTAENFNDLVTIYAIQERVKTMRAICISEQVAHCLDQAHWADIMVAQYPKQDSMLSCLETIKG